MDARQVRSRAALTAAILELSTKRPVDSLTVSEIADQAGVHRSTFYEHAASPMELLQMVLSGELDEARALLDPVAETDAGAAVSAVTEAVLEHVDRYDAIYTRGLGADSGSGSLHWMLSEHFKETSRMLLQRDVFSVPLRIDGMTQSQLEGSVTGYVASGAVGAIEAWLTTPKPRQTRPFLELFAALVPSWWPIDRNLVRASVAGNVAAGAIG
jgi:AcrR family transcriptional regulator